MKIHLKKIIVSFFVILGFVFYAIYQRSGGGQQNFVVSPTTTSSSVVQSSPNLTSSTTEGQSSSNPPLTLTGNNDEFDDDDESYSNQSSQSSANQTTTTDTSTTSTTTTDTTPASTTTTTTITVANALYKDGQYNGRVADAYYGNVQVRAIIQGGKLTDLQFLSYPSDRNQSRDINSYALPILKSEAIKAQSAQVDIISGATNTSNAFINSLSSALSMAKV